MPDTKRYTSVSVGKRAHADLEKIKSQYYLQHGFNFSIAKIIEKLATDEVRKYEQ
tara:strand:- start:247 stop:411 length:165 start_codon:yes stop_codon:yes gene_type:complete